MNKSQLVKILVPIYRSDLNKFERISLERNDKILQAYPRVFIKPASLDISKLQKEFPDFTVENFDNECFTSLQHYNQLMMSPEFYQRFCDTEYILICQLDAYIFKDELTKWCEKGYDYIGAPWIIPLNTTCLSYANTVIGSANLVSKNATTRSATEDYRYVKQAAI